MYPHTHFLFPYFIGLLLWKFNLLSWKLALLAGLMGILVDIDHYVEHLLHAKKNKFSLVDTWNNSVKQHRFYQRSFIHHWQGFLIVSAILIFWFFFDWQLFLALALGYYSHLLLDYVHLSHRHRLGAKIARFYVEEPRGEVVLDVFFIFGIMVVFII